jgi:nucleoside-diphosphate kinase
LAIIKPDAVSRGVVGEVIGRYEKQGFRIAAARMARLTRSQAEGFYAVHKERPFFGSLTQFMSSGPVLLLVLEGEDAIKRHRELMGATDPRQAAPNTIRRDLATDIEHNVVHGSDSPATAQFEIGYFFTGLELRTHTLADG